MPQQIPALALQPSARPALSPRLMEASAWALSRWCDTYLLPEEPLPGTLQVQGGSTRGVGRRCEVLNLPSGLAKHLMKARK